MLTLRRKIFLSYLGIFLLFALLLYPINTFLIESVQRKSLRKQTRKLIDEITPATSVAHLIANLKKEERYRFFRVSLLDLSQQTIYDSHEQAETSPEVKEALTKGRGYSIRYSQTYDQEIAYVALPFTFQGATYVLRTAFPYGRIHTLSEDFLFTFLALNLMMLLLFCFMAWVLIHLFTRPIRRIIKAIEPYQKGEIDHIPTIPVNQDQEFGRLAATLNSLSTRIDEQIATLIKERNEKEVILETLGEGVIAVDAEMRVIYANRTAETFLEMSKETLLGNPFEKEQFRKYLDTAQQEGTVVSATEKTETRIFDIIAIPFGKKGGGVLVLQDKTRFHLALEMEMDFIANASHELKTPITIIQGFAETLHEHPELSPEVAREIAQKIVTNSKRMEILVKNLLTLASVDEGIPPARLQKCDLNELAKQAQQTVLAIHPTAEITIEEKDQITLMGDPDLLLQALLNIVDNGVKYSKPPPAKVKITLSLTDTTAQLSISDQGIGIPKQDLERIFQRFYAVDKSHSRSLGGSGLGLSIVSRIIERHGGTISVESTVGEGTTFTVTLPS